MSINLKPKEVTVHPHLPPADLSAFETGVPLVPHTNATDVLVLYGADFELIGTVDNTDSDSATTFTRTVTTGLTFTATTSVSLEVSTGVNIEVFNAGVKLGFSTSISRQTSIQHSDSMAFSVPAGKKTFVYQGFLKAKRLSHDNSSGDLAYTSAEAQFLSQSITTRRMPLTSQS